MTSHLRKGHYVHGGRVVTDKVWDDAQVLWDYHQLYHTPRPCSAAIALGSYDIGVATHAATLFKEGLFPVLVFTGGTSVATVDRFPGGEAVAFRVRALELGVPDSVILVEPDATNTGENFSFSRRLLAERGHDVESIMVICMPYMQRRAYATCVKQWPQVDVVCASMPIGLREFARTVGDPKVVIDELVGDLQRVMLYPSRGFAVEQVVPSAVAAAYRRLISAGYDSRLISG